jgi:predicted signal transduction protein with EAL and GGDEF domain
VFVDSDTRNRDVFDIFNADPNLQNVAVIGEGGVVGLINRDSFMRSMAKPYFKELYEKKRCVKFMDEAALVVEAKTPILELADKLLNSSSKYRLSDGFAITQGQQLLGTGLTHDVLASVLAIERLQTEELARTNERLRELTITDPLTGLYNRRHFNEVVDEELKRAHRGRASVG